MGDDIGAIQPGMEVFGSDEEKIGDVFDVLPGWFVVTKGFVFPTDHYIPVAAVANIDPDGRISLAFTKDEALEQGWGTDPAGLDGDPEPSEQGT